MKNLFYWLLLYTIILATSQILLKLGVNQLGPIDLKNAPKLIMDVLANPALIFGTILLGSTFFIWMVILSKFPLSLAFPLTAMAYVFVGILSFFFLGEKLMLVNYFGIFLIACGLFFLLYK